MRDGDGWMEGSINGMIDNRWADEKMMDGCMNGQMEGWVNRWNDDDKCGIDDRLNE